MRGDDEILRDFQQNVNTILNSTDKKIVYGLDLVIELLMDIRSQNTDAQLQLAQRVVSMMKESNATKD